MDIVIATLEGNTTDGTRSLSNHCTSGPHTPHLLQGFGVLPQYEQGWRSGTDPIVAFIHDDVLVHEKGWDDRVEQQFQDPAVGLVGFGGALQHGHPALYKIPYHLTQLGRSLYYSNTVDAETHGERFAGVMDVAVLDGFALILRRELLEQMGGWLPEEWPPHHIYDYRVCCEAHRHGYRVRLVGVGCTHLGGRSACKSEYQEWARSTKWGSDVGMHQAGHRMLYEKYRDVLPWQESHRPLEEPVARSAQAQSL